MSEPIARQACQDGLTESPLLGSEGEFRRLLDKLPAGAYTCNAQGLITYYNQRAVELWGRAPKLNDPADRFCGSFKLYRSDGSPITHDQCWMALALQNEAEYNGEEIVIERADGSRVSALAHANPVLDKSGALIGAVNVLVDISDRKRSEESQARLAAIVESSDDAIISKTLEGQILTWNSGAERLFGYSAQEAIGSPITLIIPDERRDEETMILSKLRRGERIDHYETVRVARDGRRIDISLTVSPLRDSAGRIIGASKVGRDITSQKQVQSALAALKDKLVEDDRRKDEFLATLAHELRNPLAPLSNSLRLLRMDDDLGPAPRQLREIMERQVSYIARLVDDLLEVSRITRGKIELRKEEVELAAVLASAVENSRPLIEAAGHQLAISVAPEPLTLEADPVRLAQVITNLLTNAAKYMDDGGQIWLTAQRQGNEAVVSVRDAGLGIPADMLERVFDMFAQVDQTVRRAQGGLGIGLTLAKSFVEMHGGRIEVRSEGLGLGSEFIVRLPVVSQARLPKVRPAATQGELTPLPKRRILVVDDTEAAAYTLGRLLEKMGQEVRTAHDAAAALEIVQLQRPDMVISDIAMPHMDGYELARRLRHLFGSEHLILVALTGYGQESDRQRAQQAGFDCHLVKPVCMEALNDLLASRVTADHGGVDRLSELRQS